MRVALHLDGAVQVPRELRAVVAHRSAVGEQYVDLRPETDSGPYLAAGEVIPVERTGLPLPIETLLSNLDALVSSVDVDELTVLIDELGTAFEGNEAALRLILDANSALLEEASRRCPRPPRSSRTPRPCCRRRSTAATNIRRFASALAQLTKSVREADPDLRQLLANGPPASAELLGLLRDVEPSLAPLLGNLITVNGIAVRRLAGIEQLLVVYPLVVAGAFTVAPGDGTAHLGLALNVSDPPACNYYQTGQQYRCSGGELSQGSGVRSSTNAPRAGTTPTPAPLAQGSPHGPGPSAETATGTSPVVPVATYDPVTGLVIGPDGQPIWFGGTGGQAATAGAQSWKVLLLP